MQFENYDNKNMTGSFVINNNNRNAKKCKRQHILKNRKKQKNSRTTESLEVEWLFVFLAS